MDKAKVENKSAIRVLMPRFFKALFKTLIIYLMFAIFSSLIIPFEGLYAYSELFTALFALYLVFIFIIEMVKGTVFQHIFSITNSLVIVLSFSYMLNTSIINFTIEQFNLMIDLRFFLAIFVLGSILGFAKSMLQLINWMNEKEELWLQSQIKSL